MVLPFISNSSQKPRRTVQHNILESCTGICSIATPEESTPSGSGHSDGVIQGVGTEVNRVDIGSRQGSQG